MLKDLTDKLPSATQPTGSSGLPLAAEMILRAIAEQVDKLAHAQLGRGFDHESLTQPELEALNQTLSEFLNSLKTHCVHVAEFKSASQKAIARPHDSAAPLENLMSVQRNLNAKANASILQLSQQLQRIVADGDPLTHLGSLAQDVNTALNRLKHEFTEREKDSPQIVQFLNDTLAYAELQKSEIKQLRSEVGSLRSSLRRAQSTWSALQNEVASKASVSQEIKQHVESLKVAASHIQVLAVNTGIEATKTANEDSGLSYISSDLRQIAEQCGKVHRALAQKVSALGELAQEFESANQTMTSKDIMVRESLTQVTTDSDSDSHLHQNHETAKKRIESALRENNKKTSDSISQLEAIIKSHFEPLSAYHAELPEKLESLRQSARNFEMFMSDVKSQSQLTQQVAQEQHSLRTIQQKFSERLNLLTLETSRLQSEAETAWKAITQHLTRTPSDEHQQITEINEQLKQCAQEIFSLVDTPDTRRMAS